MFRSFTVRSVVVKTLWTWVRAKSAISIPVNRDKSVISSVLETDTPVRATVKFCLSQESTHSKFINQKALGMSDRQEMRMNNECTE
jgi:hypothetical protein